MHRSCTVVCALTAAASMAQAEWFTFGDVEDWTMVTRENPLVMQDAVDSALSVTIQPLVDGASIQKFPTDPFTFPSGSEGYLGETWSFASGFELVFSRPVACEPGFGLGAADQAEWTAYSGDVMVAQQTFVLDGSGLGSFSVPAATIDRLEIRGYSTAQGIPFPAPMLLGDFFAASATDCPADRNGDNIVDIVDLLNYLDHWLRGTMGAEQTGDNPASIDVADLLFYLSNWFQGISVCS